MLCKEFDQLSHVEKIDFIGRLVHAVQNDTLCFIQAEQMIMEADNKGLFAGVTINPQKSCQTLDQ